MLRVHLALLAVQIAFASLSVVAKQVMRELPPWGLVAIRALAATLILWAIALARRRWRVPRADLAPLAGLAVLGIAANQLLFIAGLARTTATMALVLGTTIPVFTVAIAVSLRREPPTVRSVGGVVLGLVGAVVAIGPGGGDQAHLVGDALILLNSLCYAFYLVLGRPMVQRHDPLVVTTWIMTFGAVMVLPFGVRDAVAGVSHLSTNAWLGIAWIVGAATVGTYSLNSWALARAPSSVVASYIYVQPVVGAILAAILLGERPTAGTVAGAVLIAAGIWIVTARTSR